VPALVEQTITLLGKGLETGITPPRVTLRDVPTRSAGSRRRPAGQPLLRQFAEFPRASRRPNETSHAAARDAYTQRIAPAYRKLYDYFVGRTSRRQGVIGMRALPTALPGMPIGSAIHHHVAFARPDPRTGLREVKRIRALMDSVIASTGFKGSFADFARFLRTDPQFFYSDSASLGARTATSRNAPTPGHQLFGRLPACRMASRHPSFMAKSQTTAYYEGGSLEQGGRAISSSTRTI